MSEFNQKKYIEEYKKEHYKVFRAYLKKDEFNELVSLLKKRGISRSDFLKYAMQKLLKENAKK